MLSKSNIFGMTVISFVFSPHFSCPRQMPFSMLHVWTECNGEWWWKLSFEPWTICYYTFHDTDVFKSLRPCNKTAFKLMRVKRLKYTINSIVGKNAVFEFKKLFKKKQNSPCQKVQWNNKILLLIKQQKYSLG